MTGRDSEPGRRTERKSTPKQLGEEELAAERGGRLPDREALSVLDANIAIPADPAIAAEVLLGGEPPDSEPELAGGEGEPAEGEPADG
jgi:hypothetical protein